MDSAMIGNALLRLDAWLDTMRGPYGYGGPVAHWWQHSLHYTGAGLDWRYEGIILGYLALHRRTGQDHWLSKARRAGDDLLRGQLPSGAYRHSSFELNPYPGGTPHEAAADLGLLALASSLRERGDSAWSAYLDAAQRNLRDYYLAQLWDRDARSFRDHPQVPSFVPNKAATLAEALLELARLTGDEAWAHSYALPTLDAVLAHQVRGGPLDGAIYQYSTRGRPVARFFPYYIARCVPGLLAGYAWGRHECYLDAARHALAFVWRWRDDDGAFPQVVYPGGRANRHPRWVAASGDILRALALLRPYGLDGVAPDLDPALTRRWLLRGQGPTGALRTACGFASQVSQREPGPVPDFFDLLPVCGWADKAFRCLAESLPSSTRLPDEVRLSPHEADCLAGGRPALYRETEASIELHQGAETLYRWLKGAPWAAVCSPALRAK